jgi:hypothetical protein
MPEKIALRLEREERHSELMIDHIINRNAKLSCADTNVLTEADLSYC